VNDDGLKNDKCKMKIAKSCRAVNGDSAVILHFSLIIFHFAMASLAWKMIHKTPTPPQPYVPQTLPLSSAQGQGEGAKKPARLPPLPPQHVV
jgi:hypothetical protein